MFSTHNGHNFILIEDAVKNLERDTAGLFSTYEKLNALEASKSESKFTNPNPKFCKSNMKHFIILFS